MIQAIKRFILKDLLLEVKDIRSLNYLRMVHNGYIPWSGASIHPTALTYILNDIIIHKRKHYLECGSGVSTIYIAAIAKLFNPNLIIHSIDHDLNWINLLKKHLELYGLSEFVHFIHAPLNDTDLAYEQSLKWYDMDIITKELSDQPPIDLLFVDGPVANKKHLKHSRYPAVPFFFDRLDDTYKIVIDDGSRNGEIDIMKRWNKDLGLNFKLEIMNGDISIASKGNEYNVQ